MIGRRQIATVHRVLLAAVGVILAPPGSAQTLETAAAPPARSTKRFHEVPDFEFTEASGRVVARADLLGEPWIAVPFFTSCPGPCPRLSADIRRYLHDQLADTDVRIVSFTVDPARDTPEVLAAYRDSYRADPERWWFLTGEPAVLHAFLRAGLYFSVQVPTREQAEELDLDVALLEIAHSTRLPVIDAEGRIAGWYSCGGEHGPGALTETEIEGNFARLLARARFLDGRSSRLPLVNATLNATTFVLLVLGLAAIKRGRRERHALLMRTAFVASAAFLACYVYYHSVVLPASGGPTRYHGVGWRRPAYYALLISHVALAVVNLPMVLRTLWLAHRQDWERHKRLARKTFPIWLYVSITGVLVYLILYHGNPLPS